MGQRSAVAIYAIGRWLCDVWSFATCSLHKNRLLIPQSNYYIINTIMQVAQLQTIGKESLMNIIKGVNKFCVLCNSLSVDVSKLNLEGALNFIWDHLISKWQSFLLQ